ASKAGPLAREGSLNPLTFRTNCSAAARTSSSVAGWSARRSVLMLRHMRYRRYRLELRPGTDERMGCMSGAVSTAPVEVDRPSGEEVAVPDRPWVVIVWNDPINLMSYVTWVFQKLFGYSLRKATELMLDVHQRGRAVVS